MAKAKLKKHTSGNFRSTFYFNGKQYNTYSKISQKDANNKSVLKREALVNGEVGISKNMNVKNWCNHWLKTYKEGVVLDKSYTNYKRYINSFIIPAIGNFQLKDVTNTQLQEILNSRAEYSKSDNSKLRYAIQQIFNRAKIDRYIKYDPSEELEVKGTDPKARRSITDIERDLILKQAEIHNAGAWIKTMLYCGLRNGEIIALDFIDLDLNEKMIYITKAKESGNDNIKEPKTKAGNREVPIPEILLNELKELKKGKNPYDPVFTKNGKRYNDKSFNREWNNFLRHLDINNGAELYNNKIIKSTIASDLIPYYLRHTFCTDLEEAGVPINIASRLMGHSNIQITSKIYTHKREKTLQATAEKMNNFHRKAM